MSYYIKEIFYSLQGEGAQTGKAAVFCRFSGCNLWSGREEDRTDAICQFCDTDFVGINGIGGGKFETAEALANAVALAWKGDSADKQLLVCTGGEPLLQLDADLVKAFHQKGFKIAIETNGTQQAPKGIDWICVSPKAGSELKLQSGDELKLVYPQKTLDPTSFISLNFKHFFLQPQDGPLAKEHTKQAIQYCLEHPKWRLSLQTHKFVGIL